MNKGIVGFIVGLIAVLGGAFVATMLLKNKFTKKDDEYDDFDDYDEIDDEEFIRFFGEDEDEMPVVNDDEIDSEDDEEKEEEDKEEQL